MEKLYLGVDIGGTNVKFGVINEKGKIFEKSTIKIGDDTRDFVVFPLIVKECERLFLKWNFVAIGVGIPGLIDEANFKVVCSGNLNWQNVDVYSYFKSLNLPLKIGNDANVATLGEAKFGGGKDFNSLVMLTLGTGVGSGIIINGKIFSGNGSAGAEIGHMIIEANGKPCTCGGKGCFEVYASATALKEATKKAMIDHPNSLMWQIGGLDKVSGKTAFSFYERDEFAKAVVDSYLHYLSVGIINVANIFRPDAIILGGGVSHEGERLINPLKEKLKRNIFAKDLGPKVSLRLATLKNDAGFMGAGALNF